jgi:hypothetical protein
MSKLREAATLALDALESVPTSFGNVAYTEQNQAAINALRQAIEQAEKVEPAYWYSAKVDEFMTHKIRMDHERLGSYTHKVGEFDTPLYTHPPTAPAQEEELCHCDKNNLGEPGVSCGDCPTRDYKTPTAPAQWTPEMFAKLDALSKPLIEDEAAPAQPDHDHLAESYQQGWQAGNKAAQQQPLTEQRIHKIWRSLAEGEGLDEFARAIEAAHGIKGETK